VSFFASNSICCTSSLVGAKIKAAGLAGVLLALEKQTGLPSTPGLSFGSRWGPLFIVAPRP
jgi:hypothetical protein